MGRTIGIVSGKGGVGKTTLTANLAFSMKNFNRTVVAVDCNITTPHLAHYMGSSGHTVTLNDVLKGKFSIPTATYYNKGVHIVPSSDFLEDLVNVNIEKLNNSLKILNMSNDIVLLDSAPSLGKEAMSTLQSCNEIILITTPQYPDFTDAIKVSLVAKEMGITILGIVLNKVGFSRNELSEERINSISGIPVIAKIPFDKYVVESVKYKTPMIQFKPFSRTSEEFNKLAASVLGESYKPRNRFNRFYQSLIFRTKTGSQLPNELRFTNENFKTEGDDILNYIKYSGDVSMNDLKKRFTMSDENIYKWCGVLEQDGKIKSEKSFFGNLRYRAAE